MDAYRRSSGISDVVGMLEYRIADAGFYEDDVMDIAEGDWHDEEDFPGAVVSEHKTWLRQQSNVRCLSKWKHLFRNERQSAIHEAIVRRFFQRAGCRIEGNESPDDSYPAPDFRCSKAGVTFYVEAMYIPTESVVEKSGIPDNHTGGTHYQLMTDRLSSVSRQKLRQCRNLNAPTLIAVGAFHSHAPLLFGNAKVAQLLIPDTYTGPPDKQEGPGAAFFTKTGEVICKEISGLLFFRSVYEPPVRCGILHPEPTYVFDTSLLPDVDFGSLRSDNRSVQWSKADQEEMDLDDETYFSNLRELGLSAEEIELHKKERRLFDDEV